MVRGNKSRRGRARGARGLRSMLRARFDGITPRGKDDPPRIIANPWNTVTLVSRGVTTGEMQSVTPSSVRTVLVSQLGLTGFTGKLDFRFLRVDAWLDPINTTGGTATSNLGLLPSNFQTALASYQDGLAASTWIEDVGTPVKHAHCHYIWPASSAAVSVNSGYSQAVYKIDTKTKGLGFTQHLHLLWRSSEADLVPSYRIGEMFEHLTL